MWPTSTRNMACSSSQAETFSWRRRGLLSDCRASDSVGNRLSRSRSSRAPPTVPGNATLTRMNVSAIHRLSPIEHSVLYVLGHAHETTKYKLTFTAEIENWEKFAGAKRVHLSRIPFPTFKQVQKQHRNQQN